ncbi:hypothetical protein K1T71_014157 [Dendrolimus kikuchii]|uniref:Uncharacterized protein n=1 Tax=Dendrolimus kikuchii TaxID=765133 RepID=A0ACC1CFH5_9NEOP|nr:hypothetical protein K1T71_014157 [Dendrolimus kikuchii]
MEKPVKSTLKRKHKSNTKPETKEAKIKKLKPQLAPGNSEPTNKSEARKVTKLTQQVEKVILPVAKVSPQVAKVTSHIVNDGVLTDNMVEKYPVLKNEELVAKFMNVPLNNNQKGRIRQAILLKYRGTASDLLPEVIHSKIQGILKSSENLTDSDLRRIRIMYNMLKTALIKGSLGDEIKKKKKPKTRTNKEGEKGPKRYIVFLGNLPLDVDKEKIKNHFVEMNEQIVAIRIPKIKEGKKSAIAYLELSNEPSYELALSKHHSMLGTKRINVLYSIQKNSKISKAEAKSTSAKLIALQKSGKLIGSVPLAKKRSQRRMKMKKAKAKQDD